MRYLSIFFYVLAGLSILAWAYFYVWVSAMACAFGNPNGGCRIKMPWELGREDAIFLLFYPGLIVVVLFLIAFLIGRQVKKSV